jgi:hypothetical protein
MKTGAFGGLAFLRRQYARRGHIAAFAVIVACALAGLSAERAKSQSAAYVTTLAYVTQFYPLWFTYYQFQIATHNRLVGPTKISPLYQIVVAINDDTLYASTFLELATQPIVLTIPATTATYSILTLDPYGDVFDVGLPAQTAGTFALTGPGFVGTLPAELTPIAMPFNFMSLIFRADKFSSTNQDQTSLATAFRAALKTQTLCDYQNLPCPNGVPHDPSGGTALILPEIAFAAPFKTAADGLAKLDPVGFLKQLQVAVKASNTPPKSAFEQGLSDQFNVLFGKGNVGQNSDLPRPRGQPTKRSWTITPRIWVRATGSTSPISAIGAMRCSTGRRSRSSSSSATTSPRRRTTTRSRTSTALRSTGKIRVAMS